jgi:peptidoglycan/xylan/chitin deacetylase (PgdA/CDA1 family)
LVLTGDEFADGADVIAGVLKNKNIKASFFLTGNFYRNKKFSSAIKRLKIDGHYLGAHSDKHLLYADWTKRDSLLVSEREFKKDLKRNYKSMERFGIGKKDAVYFLPPYEWYNRAVATWTDDLDLVLVNFSPGTLSTADYTFPEMKNYRSSEVIYNSILAYERKSPSGLNGFILLVHVGTDRRRTDKFYLKLDTLLDELTSKGYSFVRIDDLLD